MSVGVYDADRAARDQRAAWDPYEIGHAPASFGYTEPEGYGTVAESVARARQTIHDELARLAAAKAGLVIRD